MRFLWIGLIAPLLAVSTRATSAGIDGNSIHATDSLAGEIPVADVNKSDRIEYLPGFDGDFSQYDHHSGYITVGESGTRHLFYYLAKSQSQAKNVPVVLWLNGGPGCSSFDGFVYELGPFSFRLDGRRVVLSENPHAWTNEAHVVFLDSPAGVGLSYSDNPGTDYNTGDIQTAKDAQQFLLGFFDRHPDLQENEFYIAGESYAGIYVPNLAKEVVLGNGRGDKPHINIKGYMVGNGCTDDEVDGNAHPPFILGKSMMTYNDFKAIESACDGVYWARAPGSECDSLFNKMMMAVSAINIYDTLENCYLGPEPDLRAGKMQEALEKHGRVWPMMGTTPKSGSQVLNWAHLGLTPPCTDSRQAANWLNNDAVRKALHAEPMERIGRFTLCSDLITYTKEHNSSVIPVHRMLVEKHGLRALIYSGDHDMCVPHTGSETWTSGLKYRVKSPWQPWFYADKMGAEQVAGFTVEYERGLTYATIKGAGHMVPETNPIPAFEMFKRFLRGEPLYPPKQ